MSVTQSRGCFKSGMLILFPHLPTAHFLHQAVMKNTFQLYVTLVFILNMSQMIVTWCASRPFIKIQKLRKLIPDRSLDSPRQRSYGFVC